MNDDISYSEHFVQTAPIQTVTVTYETPGWWLCSRVLVLYKANYKSSPMQVLFFLGLLHNILRPLTAF